MVGGGVKKMVDRIDVWEKLCTIFDVFEFGFYFFFVAMPHSSPAVRPFLSRSLSSLLSLTLAPFLPLLDFLDTSHEYEYIPDSALSTALFLQQVRGHAKWGTKGKEKKRNQ